MLAIQRLIKENPNDWEKILISPPYCLKIDRDYGYILFKYNQYTSDLSLPEVQEARGIIFKEDTMELKCYPFKKFFNIGEPNAANIDWSNVTVEEKVDGSLIKIWYDDQMWHISSNGKIDAFKCQLPNCASKEITNLGHLFITVFDTVLFHDLDKSCCYMFEVVSPDNRIVVPYKETKLYFLGARDMKTLKEKECWIGVEKPKWRYYKDVDGENLKKEILEEVSKMTSEQEGYVVRDRYFNRVKIKSPEYIKVHYMKGEGELTTKRILGILRENEKDEYLAYFPEFKNRFKEVEKKLKTYKEDMHIYKQEVIKWRDKWHLDRKAVAENILAKRKKESAFCFAVYDGKVQDEEEWISKIMLNKLAERIDEI